MGFFELEFREGNRRERRSFKNSIMYRAHVRILRRAVNLGESTGVTFRLGISGPNYLRYDQRPNFQIDNLGSGPGIYNVTSRGKLSDFIAGSWSNDGGMPEPDVRAFEDYQRRAVSSFEVGDDESGAVVTTGWAGFESRVPWAPRGNWKPDDYDIEYPSGPPFRKPPDWLDVAAWEKPAGYPWDTPNIFPGWWQSYQNCLDPANNFGGTCPTHPPQSGYPSCPTCAAQGIWGLSVYPVGCVYLTIQRPGETEEAFAAAIFNGPAWFRRSGGIYARYSFRVGLGHCSASYAQALAGRLVDAAHPAPPWQYPYQCIALKLEAAGIPITPQPQLTADMLVFPQRFDASWTFQDYAPPVYDNASPPNLITPEVLPRASLQIGPAWTNATADPVTIKTLGIAALNTDTGQWELLFWGAIDSPVTVAPGDSWKPAEFHLRLTDVLGN